MEADGSQSNASGSVDKLESSKDLMLNSSTKELVDRPYLMEAGGPGPRMDSQLSKSSG